MNNSLKCNYYRIGDVFLNYTFNDIKDKNYVKIGSYEGTFDSNIEMDQNQQRNRFKKIIEPWLSAALQTDHLSLLLGSGFTTAVCQIAGVSSSSMEKAKFGEFSQKINEFSTRSAEKMGRGSANIEDQIRTAFSLLRGYEIEGKKKEYERLSNLLNSVLENFTSSILSSETNLKNVITNDNGKKAISTLQSFLLTFASRTATRERTHIFTTNYDRIIEYGCDVSGIKILDRFWGKVIPKFEESPSSIDYYYHTPDAKNEFRYAEGVVRYSKIHGSIDWYEDNGTVYRDALRFGTDKISLPNGTTYRDHLMIYPNSMKSVETAFYPYAELFRDFGSSICRPNSTLFTYGYGFGDTHINKIIKEMLMVPSTHIVIISYQADERLKSFLESVNMAQITLLLGEEFASLEKLVDYYLPKAAIDMLTTTASKLLEARKTYSEIGDERNKGGTE